eukprot:TRINITY_DN13687_c3_g1_i1.p1 TRINITY_DN13687_c3_g1~~TRINITY_DN13687_c3_g1_i1.p1  ORF type:complete len:349 (+),score=74.41 TRINITY_DN13687_c3_g1_i1:57-1049(+)
MSLGKLEYNHRGGKRRCPQMDNVVYFKRTQEQQPKSLTPAATTTPAALTDTAAVREEKRMNKLMNDIKVKEAELAALRKTAGFTAAPTSRPTTPQQAAARPATPQQQPAADPAPMQLQSAPKTLAPLKMVPKQLEQIDPTADKILRLRGGSPPPPGRRTSTPTRAISNVNDLSTEVVEKPRKNYRRDLVGSGAAGTFDPSPTNNEPMPLATQRRGRQQMDPNAAGSLVDKPKSKKVFRSESPAGGIVTMRETGVVRGKAMRSPSPYTGAVTEIGFTEQVQHRNRKSGGCAPPSQIALGNPETITQKQPMPAGKSMPGGLRKSVFNPILGV